MRRVIWDRDAKAALEVYRTSFLPRGGNRIAELRVKAVTDSAEEARLQPSLRLPIIVNQRDTGFFKISCPSGYLIGCIEEDRFIIVDFIATLEIESYIRRTFGS